MTRRARHLRPTHHQVRLTILLPPHRHQKIPRSIHNLKESNRAARVQRQLRQQAVNADRPPGIIEKIDIPIVSDLLIEIRNAEPKFASMVVDLYDFSYAALEEFSAHISAIREEVATSGKAIKAISIPTTTAGFTYAVTRQRDWNAADAANAIGAKHKFDARRDRWFVILDSIETDNPIDGLLPLVWPWEDDEREAKNSEIVAKLFDSKRVTKKSRRRS